MKIEDDVELLFDTITVNGTDIDRQIIERIEQGKYNNTLSFIDRFGCKLWYENMSTGCKAALCVANSSRLLW